MNRLLCGLCLVGSLLAAGPPGHAQDTKALIEQYRQGREHWPAAQIDDGVTAQELAPLSQAVQPQAAPSSPALEELGRHLFFDRRLSRSRQISCASCHDPGLGWADGLRQSIGHDQRQNDMHAPTVVNTRFLPLLFWDGRSLSLEQQVIESWSSPVEMAADPSEASRYIAAVPGYGPLFEQAFGEGVDAGPGEIATAIAAFMRSLVMDDTPFDRFLEGDSTALSDQQIMGLHLFRTKARCIQCHSGALLSDNRFHHLGTSFHEVGNFQGRYRMTGKAEDVGAFRTPGLRGAALTPPYMHNGLVADLEGVLALYNLGWWQNEELRDKSDDIPTATLSPLIRPLALSEQELAALMAFLQSLAGDFPQVTIPEELN